MSARPDARILDRGALGPLTSAQGEVVVTLRHELARLVEAHDGRIRIREDRKIGATIEVALPLAEGPTKNPGKDP